LKNGKARTASKQSVTPTRSCLLCIPCVRKNGD